MKTVWKGYRSAFLVDKSKLTRLMSVVKEELDQDGVSYREHFIARLSNAKIVSTGALSDIFDLDNSRKSRIVGLLVTADASNPPSTTPDREIEVEFDGREPVDVTIDIKSDDSKWASHASAIVEEQVERTLQTTLISRMRNSPDFGLSILASVGILLVLAIIVPVFFSTLRDLDTRVPERTMWLTSDDLAMFRERLHNSARLSLEEVAELQTRQLRNVVDGKSRGSQAKPSKLVTWKSFFLVLPFLLVGAALVYAAAACYPPAVFLWGDAEEWYATLASRRRALWSVVIIAMTVGIIANLFVLGVADALKS